MKNTIKLYKAGDENRLVPIEADKTPEPFRSAFRRDYARLLHSPALRRLQGKTQLFPSHESDFFRNRLTHSMEVAQVAKSIAIKINQTNDEFKLRGYEIDTDLIEFSALAHDLGHPPFGHNGEEALDRCMRNSGGFEGNAQTLRILTKLEKRSTFAGDGGTSNRGVVAAGVDRRTGLNLTFRALASVLKYDVEIPRKRSEAALKRGPRKGYYFTETSIVHEMKRNIGADLSNRFKTVECSIMDTADDVAYSTYDLEDAFKGRFLTPASILNLDDRVAQRIAKTITERAQRYYPDLPEHEWQFKVRDVYYSLLTTFSDILNVGPKLLLEMRNKKLDPVPLLANIFDTLTFSSEQIATNGYFRTGFTSELLKQALDGIEVLFNKSKPHLTIVRLNIETFRKVEVLKNLAFESLVMSPMLKVAEYRGKEIVTKIFNALSADGGHMIMPDDFKILFEGLRDPMEKDRVICDFVAGMTNRYAVQFYNRLFGTIAESIYQPI